MKNKIAIYIVIFILVIFVGFYMYRSAKAPEDISTSNIESTTNAPFAEKQNNLNTQVSTTKTVIEMTSSGFNPKVVTVKAGTEIVFINKDTAPHWPASGPHPAHTCYPGFDALRPIAPGTAYTHVFDLVKSCGFHDHLNFSTYGYGNITVE